MHLAQLRDTLVMGPVIHVPSGGALHGHGRWRHGVAGTLLVIQYLHGWCLPVMCSHQSVGAREGLADVPFQITLSLMVLAVFYLVFV
jgi:hypothetical protein